MNNRLYYGDNLEILRSREYFPDECVDLIYLDPPFNSNRNYNVLFKSESGTDSEAQITAFEDTWHWSEAALATYFDLVQEAPARVVTAIKALMDLIGHNQMMAYLVMMAARLVELERVLKPTGSLYLHCDPTASHYLKILLDAIFDPIHFKNELIWKRTSSHNDANRFGKIHDVILFYSKSEDPKWNNIYQPYDEEYVKQYYRYQDDDGRRWMSGDLSASGLSGGGYEYEWNGVIRVWRCPIETMRQLENENRIYYTRNGIARIKRYLDESEGQLTNDLWTDIEALRSWHKERLSYPTQKPEALLERIIQASSDEGDIVLDPFCGCGTAIVAAHTLNRRWIGIDITHLSIALQKYRLQNKFELDSGADYEVIGEPTTVSAARALANDPDNEGRYQFEWWALSLVGAKPVNGKPGSRKGKKGADRGIDGIINFIEGTDDKGKPIAKTVIVQVKSGKVTSRDIRDLKGTVERENAAIGVFITLDIPTQAMLKEALAAEYYEPLRREGKRYRKIQILTIGDLLDGDGVDMPGQHGMQLADQSTSTGGNDTGNAQRSLI